VQEDFNAIIPEINGSVIYIINKIKNMFYCNLNIFIYYRYLESFAIHSENE